jgi:hypothetical protein
MRMNRDMNSQGYFSCFAALLLLAQLLLAGAHVHSTGPHGIHMAASASHDTGRVPAGPLDHDDAACPLCWVQAAASNLLLPPPIQIRVPPKVGPIQLALTVQSLAQRTAPHAFRSRAPPSHPRLTA